jgi:hypothetical protein
MQPERLCVGLRFAALVVEPSSRPLLTTARPTKRAERMCAELTTRKLSVKNRRGHHVGPAKDH